MKKRVFSLLLALLMVLGLLPAAAFAAEGGCVQIGSQTYNSLTDAVTAASEGVTLWLIGDDTTEQLVTIDKSLTVELQGHALSSTALKVTGSTTSVTINDRVGTGSINRNHYNGFSTDHNRCTATVVVADGATLTINGVTGTSSDTGTVIYDCAENDLEKALFVQGASTLVINGGTFAAQVGAGRDALFVYDGTVTINDGYFYMNLSYNTAPTDANPLKIKKCEIYNPKDSGAVWIQNSGSINGVSFSTGFQSLESIQKVFLATSTGSTVLTGSTKNHVKIGCGIYASTAVSSTTLADGTIYAVGSTNENSPEQITPENGDKITLAPQIAGGDGTTISYTWTKDGSTLSGANGSTYTINSYSSGDDGSYTVTATQDETSVCFYYQIGSSSDNSGAHSHCVCGGSVSTGGHIHDATTPTWTTWDGNSTISYDSNNTAYVYLTDSITPSSSIKVTDGQTLNLCLNGYTLSHTSTVITVTKGATLNICDCKGGGKIESIGNPVISNGNSVGPENPGTLNLYGGEISGNCENGTIFLYNNTCENAETVAVFNMYGGTVMNNGYYSGYAVCASFANIGKGYYNINIYGGNVTCEEGYGISDTLNGSKNITMQIAGGTITSGWYGIQLYSGNTLTLSGSPQFIDGGDDDSYAGIYIPDNVTLTVASDFAPADNTTVSVKKSVGSSGSVVFAQPATNTNSLSGKAQYFVSSEEGYFVECGEDGNLQLSTCAITEQPTKDNSYTVTANGSDSGKVKYQWSSATAGTVKVTDKNATAGEYSGYYEYGDRWHAMMNAESANAVTWKAFTLHMAEGDVLTVEYEDMRNKGSGSDSWGYFNDFTLTGNDQTCDSTTGSEGYYYTTKTFTAPADGDYTLTVKEMPESYSSGSYYLNGSFSATVTADVAGDVLSGQTVAALNTTGLDDGKYICAVTWEDKTTLYSKAVNISAPAHSHCVCGGENRVGDHTTHTDIEWTAWDGTSDIEYTDNVAYVCLTKSVERTTTLTVPSNYTLYLCLNGKTITGASGQNAISVNSGANLTITDCGGTGTITHNSGDTGRGIYNNGTLNLWDGSITGNTTDEEGGGVYNSGSGTFTMYGGSIANCTAKGDNPGGGGVYNGENGKFIMSGGKIIGCTAGRGGGVFNNEGGTFNMTDGSITDCTASTYRDDSLDGGGVCSDGTFNMSGGSITNCTAGNRGGGVYNWGPFNMSGGAITGNTAPYGGGVCHSSSFNKTCTFAMSDGEISGNTASTNGGGVYNENAFHVSGNPNISGNKLNDDTTNNVYLLSSKTIQVTASMGTNASVGITGNLNQTVVTGTTNAIGFTSDNEDYELVPNDETSLKLSPLPVIITSVPLYSSGFDNMIDSTKVYDGIAVGHGDAVYENTALKDFQLTYTWQELTTDSIYSELTEAPSDAGSYRLLVTAVKNGVIHGSKSCDFTITPRTLTIGDLTVANKTYDGTGKATISGTPTLVGLVSCDEDKVTLAGGTPTFTIVNAGENIPVSFTDFSISGEAAKNYTLTQPSDVKANISQAALTITGATITPKTYDGKTDATVTAVSFSGLQDGETLTFGQDYTVSNAAYNTADAGDGKTVTFTVTLSDTTKAKNYSLTQSTGSVNANINAYAATGEEYTVSTSDWTNKDFTVTAKAGWKLSLTDTAGGSWVECLTRSDETGSGSMTFYVKNDTTGVISTAITKTYKIDKTAPAITGAESGKTYCAAVTLTITDQNLDSVTLNGGTVALTNDKLTVSPAAGTQSVVATDKAGNSTTVTVTVNNGHKWANGVCSECSYVCLHPGATDDGNCLTLVICPICGVTTRAAETAHEWGRYFVTTPATTTSEGKETRYCQHVDCTVEDTRAIAKLTPAPVPVETHSVSGFVKGGNGDPLYGAAVALVLGDRQIASATTDADGGYSFEGIEPGVYNLVAQKDGVTMTVKIEVKSTDVTVDPITMPSGKTSSVVEVTSDDEADRIDAVVGGLDEIFTNNTVYTENDKNIVEVQRGSVEIKLTVTRRDEKTTSEEITKALQNNGFVGIRLDLTVEKTVTPQAGEAKTTTISDTGALLETVIRLPDGLQGKSSYTVYRLHGGAVDTLTTSRNTDGEYIEVSADKTVITIHARRYSEYVLAYQEYRGSTTYAITVEDSAHGSVTASSKNAAKGSTVTLTVKPDEGYLLKTLVVFDEDGKEMTLTDKGDGEYTFTMPGGKVTVSAVFVKDHGYERGYASCSKDATCLIEPYADAVNTAWYHDGVHFCLENGLMVGLPDGSFAPSGDVTRAQVVTILWRLEGKPVVDYAMQFEDAASGEWFTEAIRWAASNGVVEGYNDKAFGPNDAITREQFAAILYRYSQFKGYDVSVGEDTNILDFDDAQSISTYAVPAIQWACGSGVISGVSALTLDPTGVTSRAQAATMFMRYCENVNE